MLITVGIFLVGIERTYPYFTFRQFHQLNPPIMIQAKPFPGTSSLKYNVLWASCLLLFVFCNSCQQSKTGKINYPQPTPDTTALTYLPGVVSKDKKDFNGVFTTDGTTFFFSRPDHGKLFIWESKYENDKWTEPAPSPAFDTMYSNADPFITAENDIYFITNRPKNATDTTKDFDIYRMSWQGTKWNAPEYLDEINSDSIEYYVSVAKNGNMYFSSYREGNLDLYSSVKKDGHYQKPVNMGPNINSAADEHDPMIAPDESYIIYPSNRPNGLGEADLYISLRKNNVWQPARNMGSRINTPTYDYCPALTPDGKYFFFSSEENVKWISASVLKKYE